MDMNIMQTVKILDTNGNDQSLIGMICDHQQADGKYLVESINGHMYNLPAERLAPSTLTLVRRYGCKAGGTLHYAGGR
jgi:hypothetical protein